MGNILDVLEKRAGSLDVQIAKAQPMTADEAAWLQIKAKVDKADTGKSHLEQLLLSAPNMTRSNASGKCNFQNKCIANCTKLEVVLEDKKPFTMGLVAVICPQHEFKHLYYYAINAFSNSMYVRDIIKNYDLQL